MGGYGSERTGGAATDCLVLDQREEVRLQSIDPFGSSEPEKHPNLCEQLVVVERLRDEVVPAGFVAEEAILRARAA